MAKHSSDSSRSSSSLKTGAERFLSLLLSHALDNGFRSPEDFIRHFKPMDLMEALEPVPELRKDILVMAVGVHEKIARRKSTQSAAEDLRIALDEGVTTAADVLEVFGPNDQVRYLKRTKLFSFAVENDFFSGQKTGAEHERAVDRMLHLIESAISEDLLSFADVADSIGFETIAQRLPFKELQKTVEHALTLGSRKEPLTDQALFDVVPLRSVLSYVPLEHVWNNVVLARVAAPSDLLDSDAKPAATRSGRVAESTRDAPKRPTPSREPPPKPAVASNGKKPVLEEAMKPAPEQRASEDDVDSLLEDADANRGAPEEDARKKVVDHLQGIGRLPPRHGDLTTPILLSIESMYAELLEAPSDEAREECIRDSFPNEQHMTSALLALIELLDPSIDVNDPVIRDADLDSLIKVVLFEERHRYELSHPSQRPASAPLSPPPPPGGMRRNTPPPLPRGASAAPPPLPNLDKSR